MSDDHLARPPVRAATQAGGAASDGPGGLIVYWRPGCPYCSGLRRRLSRSEVPAEWRNIWDDPAAAAFVRSVAGGNETVPTVIVAGDPYVNPSWRQLQSLLIAGGYPLPAPGRWQERFRRHLTGAVKGS